MDWNFDFGWFMLGVTIFISGGLVIIYHQKIASWLSLGVLAYDRIKLYALIAMIIGLTIMANLHTLFLTWLVQLIWPGLTK